MKTVVIALLALCAGEAAGQTASAPTAAPQTRRGRPAGATRPAALAQLLAARRRGQPAWRAQAGATYYVSPAGNDANAGTSPARAWQTVGKLNTVDFQPGNRILLEGGQTFAGNLYFDAADSSTAARPIVVGSYGRGRATLDAGDGTGIFVYNRAGLEILNLNVRGSGGATNEGDGISFFADLPGGAKLPHLRVGGVDVSGFRGAGIVVGAYPADASKSGYRDVRITLSRAHDNLDAGISSYGYYSNGTIPGYAHQDVYVGYCEVYNNTGIADKGNNSGNGIVLSDVDGGTVERCVAHDNGRNNGNPGGGPVGIWTWESNRVVIQFNEAYRNRTGTVDGGGFDLDGGVTNSVLQYNYSHDNDGAGYLLYQFYSARPFRHNVVRYNISQNDGRRGAYAGVYTGGGVANADVYQNTVFIGPAPGSQPRAVRVEEGSDSLRFRNNVFQTAGGVPVLEVVPSATNVVFQGNDYWSGGAPLALNYAGAAYGSLAAWRAATGQERLSGADVGYNVDPRLLAPGTAPTLGNALLLPTLAAYLLRPDSPLIDAGVDLRALGVNPGRRDFYGTPVPLGRTFDVGAHEAAYRQLGLARAGAPSPEAEVELGNFPNPFNEQTRIRYRLPEAGPVRLDVYDAYGQPVATLVNEAQPAGPHHADFDGRKLPGGLYFYRLSTAAGPQAGRMELKRD